MHFSFVPLTFFAVLVAASRLIIFNAARGGTSYAGASLGPASLISRQIVSSRYDLTPSREFALCREFVWKGSLCR
jgi:hypothetical protein